MTDRRMFRYVVPVDDQWHVIPLTHSPVAVVAIAAPVRARSSYQAVEFWAEHTEGAPPASRAFRVFGTGHPLPDDARWAGTAPRTPDGMVWHLYELAGETS